MKTILAVLLLCAARLGAAEPETITTLAGQRYEKASVEHVNPAVIKVTHDAGILLLRYTELTADMQARLGYDAEKEKAWRAATLEAQRQAAVAAAEKWRSDKAAADRDAAERAVVAESQRNVMQAINPDGTPEGLLRFLKSQRK